VLTFATIGSENVGEQFDFIQAEGEALQQTVAPWFGTTFWLTGAIVLFSTNLAVLDMVGRVTADVLKVGALRDNDRWTESRVYLIVVWAEILLGSLILLSGVSQPLLLLVIASALNGLVMFVYSLLLIRLNNGVLPASIGLKGGRLVMMWWAVLLYGGFSLFTIIDQGRRLFTGGE